jgi:hypothetical protein
MGSKAPEQPVAPAPTWYDTQIMQDGVLKATQTKNGNTITQENISTPEEKALSARRQAGVSYYTKEIPKYEKKLNTFDPNWLAEIQKAGNDYTQQQTSQFDDQYTPAYNNLVEEGVKRFGTTNSSWFMDELGKLEKIKQGTKKDINNEAYSKGQAFKQTELKNRQDYLDEMRKNQATLQSGQGDFEQQQALNRQQNADLGTKASDVTNSYNANVYSSQIQSYIAQQQARRSLLSSMMSGIMGGLGSMGNL